MDRPGRKGGDNVEKYGREQARQPVLMDGAGVGCIWERTGKEEGGGGEKALSARSPLPIPPPKRPDLSQRHGTTLASTWWKLFSVRWLGWGWGDEGANVGADAARQLKLSMRPRDPHPPACLIVAKGLRDE